jgi:uncharacterized membrane protein
LSCAEPFVFNGDSTVRATTSVVYNQQSSKGRANLRLRCALKGLQILDFQLFLLVFYTPAISILLGLFEFRLPIIPFSLNSSQP